MSRLAFAALFLVIPLVRAQPPEVAVCVRYGVAINLMVVKIGESTASRMFEPTGVRLRWTCDPRFHIHVVSQIKADTPDNFHQGALAYALPFAEGVRLVLLYDRIEPFFSRRSTAAGGIFGACDLSHPVAAV